ncbi:MAG: oxidoreductase [Planctomycetes bacterium]|nr:oxidoreductase [Planctomycetota bacterium]
MLRFPWLTLLVLLPSAGAAATLLRRSVRRAHAIGVAVVLIEVLLATGAWIDLGGRGAAADPWVGFLRMDDLSAPLFLAVAMTVAAVQPTARRAKRTTGVVATILGSEALLFLMFSSTEPWTLTVLFAAGTILPWADARTWDRGARRAFSLYMGASVMLFAIGTAASGEPWAWAPLVAAILIRKGIVPFHSWVPPFFQAARPGVAILFSIPQVGTYCAARLLVPSAPREALWIVGTASLVTAVYAAALGTIQKDARRMFGFLFMSQSAVVLAGLSCDNVPGLAGGLTLWVASVLSLAGLGVVLRALEARRGALSLARFHGGYERMRILAVSFLILGFACVGVPGTIGFIAEEILVDGTVESLPLLGFLAAIAAALNGITVLRAYGSLFCGAPSGPWPEQTLRRERLAVLSLTALLLATGIWPGPLVRAEASAAALLLSERADPRR